jgi:hypothetical protein
MKYVLGRQREGGPLQIVKVWRGEEVASALLAQGCVVEDREYPGFDTKKDALRAVRGDRKQPSYDPSKDSLIREVGKLHLGDGHIVHVALKDRGQGPEVLVQKVSMVAGSRYGKGGLGRLEIGAAKQLARLILEAVETVE